ncbi:hypothetical protein DRN63_03925 [Nanoarchaeota archaeon]|nr:MAG: hypothetical protein DRN63_03925 [Nanoarchaeota archaeon]
MLPKFHYFRVYNLNGSHEGHKLKGSSINCRLKTTLSSNILSEFQSRSFKIRKVSEESSNRVGLMPRGLISIGVLRPHNHLLITKNNK